MAKHIQKMVCITCPRGCQMELEIEDGDLKAVRYNGCTRGLDYAKQEFYDPRRMVTATAAVAEGIIKRIPVRTTEPIPVKHINDLLTEIYALRLKAPVEIGTPVIKDFAGTGIDVITTRNLQAQGV